MVWGGAEQEVKVLPGDGHGELRRRVEVGDFFSYSSRDLEENEV